MSINIADLAQNSQVNETGHEGPAQIVPLYMERGGINTNLIGVATKKGLFRFLPDVSAGQVAGLREAASNAPVPVTVAPGTVVTRTSASSQKTTRIGRLGDWNSRPRDVSMSQTDAASGARRNAMFLPISLVVEDNDTGLYRTSSAGKRMLGEFTAAAGNPETLTRLLNSLPQSFLNDYVIEDGELVAISPEGTFFLNELKLVLTGEQAAEPVTEENATAADAVGYGLGDD